LILWKIIGKVFKVITEISNISEATITSLCWSPEGDLLFISNTNGSVYILEINEFVLRSNRNNLQEQGSKVNGEMIVEQKQRRVIPMQLDNNPVSLMKNQPQNNNNMNIVNINEPIQECIKCKNFGLDQLEYKQIIIKLEPLENVSISFENKINDNLCQIKLLLQNSILYSNTIGNKMIRNFSCNNFFYAFYDTLNVLHCYTIFNTMIFSNLYIEDVSFVEVYKNYLLVVSAKNKIMIMYV
jgi:hypothetical protein